MLTILNTENTQKYQCEKCAFKCSKKSYWDRHIITAKHIKLTKANDILSTDVKKMTYVCAICDKVYKSRVGLWKHAKICKIEETPPPPPAAAPTETEYKMLTNLMLEMVKSNTELQKQMMEVCKINTTTMNIMDFVDSMTLELSDLEDVGKLGYVEGISNIIIRKLNELDVYNRPIHCSDAKREIMYVRDDNIWEKENSTYDRLRKAIKRVTYKNSSLLVPWSQKYPACMNNQHHLNDVYVQLMGQAMGGKEEFVDSENKIMKKIAKAVLIDKAC